MSPGHLSRHRRLPLAAVQLAGRSAHRGPSVARACKSTKCQGDAIRVDNNLDVPILVQPRESNAPPETGAPIGEPFFVLAKSTARITVTNSPALLGMPFELDPNT
jgi:hypothetical protein